MIRVIWHQLARHSTRRPRFRAISVQNIVLFHGTATPCCMKQVWSTFAHRRPARLIRHFNSPLNQERLTHANTVSRNHMTRRSIKETATAIWCWNPGAFHRNFEKWLRPAFCPGHGPPSVPQRACPQRSGKWSKQASI
jgi:hypothetical protein